MQTADNDKKESDKVISSESAGKSKGKVYRLICTKEEAPGILEKYSVSSMSTDEESGKVILRIVGEKFPPEGAAEVRPTLGDFFPDFPKK